MATKGFGSGRCSEGVLAASEAPRKSPDPRVLAASAAGDLQTASHSGGIGASEYFVPYQGSVSSTSPTNSLLAHKMRAFSGVSSASASPTAENSVFRRAWVGDSG